jgi:predicted amidohydrolase YtcJ
MLGDYQAGQPNAPARGLLLFDPAQMAANLVKWDKLGVTVLFHAAGDRAVRSALDAIAAARKANGMNGPIHQVGHSTLSTRPTCPASRRSRRRSNIRRTCGTRSRSTTTSPAPSANRASIASGRSAKGSRRAHWSSPGPIGRSCPSPIRGSASKPAVTRRNPGGGTRNFGLKEAITLPQAITMFSIDAARLGTAATAGSLETGKVADFIVLDRDPFAGPPTAIHDTRVLETWVGGTRIYQRTKP